MKFVLDVHNHTQASGHAYSTIEEYAAEAKKTGLSLIAITEHAPAMPNATGAFYYDNVEIIPREINGVKVMIGVELNIMDKSGRVDLEERAIKRLSPVLACFHPPCYKFSKDLMTEDEKIEEVTEAIVNVMENPLIDILGHPDDPRYPFDLETVVKKSLETGTLLEINNNSLKPGGLRIGSRDVMLKMLHACKKIGCPVVIGSDAHFSSHAGKLENSIELLKEADFPVELVANNSVEYFLHLLKRNNKG